MDFCPMIELKINIKKSVVYNEISKISSYIGAKRIDADQKIYERVFSTEDDRELLERYWREAKSMVLALLSRWLITTTFPENSQTVDDAEVWSVTLIMPDAFKKELAYGIDEDIHSFMINEILFKWLAVSEPKEAEYYKAVAETKSEAITDKLLFRTRPIHVKMSVF